MPADRTTTDFDIVLVGATGFVGALTAAHLRDHAPDGVRIAIAGRSADKLSALADDLGGAAASWERLVLDVQDGSACDALAARTRVVVTTVGPYSLYGHELIRACAEAGTHYCDLTGEVLFVRDAAEGLHDVARRTGAKIVNSCGFDSIPSDLGVWLTADQAAKDEAGTLLTTTLYVRSMKGGFSGGTIDSMRQQAKTMREDPQARRAVRDPYGLSPDRAGEPSRQERAETGASETSGRSGRRLPVRRGPDGHWTGPFVMASYNTRIVRRSNALLDWAYGRGLRYSEVSDYGDKVTSPLVATGVSAALLGVLGGMALAPTRAVIDRVLPAPGEGPSAQRRAEGRFRMEVVAETTSGAQYTTTVAAKADPGYDGTAIMLGQSALALALDDLDDRGGVLTPAVAMAAPLAERLRAHGFTLATTRR